MQDVARPAAPSKTRSAPAYRKFRPRTAPSMAVSCRPPRAAPNINTGFRDNSPFASTQSVWRSQVVDRLYGLGSGPLTSPPDYEDRKSLQLYRLPREIVDSWQQRIPD
jgi:hypothetical protein